MIITPAGLSNPRTRFTRHDFGVLVGTGNTSISWWNATDHNQPFPWRTDRTFAEELTSGLQPYYAMIEPLRMFYTPADPYTVIYPFSRSYTRISTDPALVFEVKLWAVDSAGADLFDLLDQPPAPTTNRAAHIHGVYIEQTVTNQSITVDWSNFLIEWVFSNSQGQFIAPP